MIIENAVRHESTSDSGATSVSIIATIDGVQCVVPESADNRHYDEIQRQVAAGTLTIQDAD
jgi:hypothetical protein